MNFEELATKSPRRLIDIVNSGTLEWCELSIALEAAGSLKDATDVYSLLIPMLSHPSSLIRESALVGIDKHIQMSGLIPNLILINEVYRVSQIDTSLSVRHAANDVLFFIKLLFKST